MSKKTAIAKHLQEVGVEERQAEAIAWHIVENIVPQAENPISPSLGQNLLERIVRVEEALEQMNKRFEMLIHQLDKRFEQVDRRIEQSREETKAHIEQVREEMKARFEQVDKRFEQVDKHLSHLFWMIGGWGTLLAVLMSLYQFLK